VRQGELNPTSNDKFFAQPAEYTAPPWVRGGIGQIVSTASYATSALEPISTRNLFRAGAPTQSNQTRGNFWIRSRA
jgi:hypothetical protein